MSETTTTTESGVLLGEDRRDIADALRYLASVDEGEHINVERVCALADRVEVGAANQGRGILVRDLDLEWTSASEDELEAAWFATYQGEINVPDDDGTLALLRTLWSQATAALLFQADQDALRSGLDAEPVRREAVVKRVIETMGTLTFGTESE